MQRAIGGRRTYDLKRFESIGHGEIGHVGWDLVPLAEKLKVSSEKAVEIHLRSSVGLRLGRDSDYENKMFYYFGIGRFVCGVFIQYLFSLFPRGASQCRPNIHSERWSGGFEF